MCESQLSEDFVRWPYRGGWSGAWPGYNRGWYGRPAYRGIYGWNRPDTVVVQAQAPPPQIITTPIVRDTPSPPPADNQNQMWFIMLAFIFIVALILMR